MAETFEREKKTLNPKGEMPALTEKKYEFILGIVKNDLDAQQLGKRYSEVKSAALEFFASETISSKSLARNSLYLSGGSSRLPIEYFLFCKLKENMQPVQFFSPCE